MTKWILCFLFATTCLWAQPEPLWKRAVGGRISAWQAEGPDGSLYLISEDRALHSLDPMTGVDHWFYRPGGSLIPFLAVSPDGTIFIQNDRGDIDAVNPEGQVRWRCSLGGSSTLLPLLSPEGTLILLMEKGDMAAISRKGQILWRSDIPGRPAASAVMDMQGTIYVPLEEGGVACFNRDGEMTRRLNSQTLHELILDQKGLLYGVTSQGRVYAWDKEGTELWNSGTEPGAVRSLVLRGEELFLILQDGLIYQINQQGAESVYQGPEPSFPAIITEEGNILLIEDSRILWTINPEEGLQEAVELPQVASMPLLTSGGILILGSEDWKLYAYRSSRPRTGWAQYRGNARRNGSLYSVLSPRLRQELYKDNDRYRYFQILIYSEEPENQMAVLNEIASYQSWAELNEELPFWDISLLNIAGNGVNHLLYRQGRAVETSPLARARAYQLLGQWEVYPLRPYILESLRSERDPLVLSEAYLALGRLGADWDGQSLAMIEKTLKATVHPQERQVVAAAEAYLMLMDWGGEEQSHRVLRAFYGLMDYSRSPGTQAKINALMEEYLF